VYEHLLQETGHYYDLLEILWNDIFHIPVPHLFREQDKKEEVTQKKRYLLSLYAEMRGERFNCKICGASTYFANSLCDDCHESGKEITESEETEKEKIKKERKKYFLSLWNEGIVPPEVKTLTYLVG